MHDDEEVPVPGPFIQDFARMAGYYMPLISFIPRMKAR